MIKKCVTYNLTCDSCQGELEWSDGDTKQFGKKEDIFKDAKEEGWSMGKKHLCYECSERGPEKSANRDIMEMIMDYFEDDLAKTTEWFARKNPMLGNVSPSQMLNNGRYEKLQKFIRNSLDENRVESLDK